MLDPFGIKYESTIVNSYPIFACFLFAIVLHLILLLLKWAFSKLKDSENIFIRFMNFLIEKTFIMMTFGYYIRNALEISQFILISSINEIYQFKTSETLRLASFIYAILMIICYIFILGISNYLIFSLYKLNEEGHNKLGELFICLQDNKKSRFYLTMLLLRRLIFVSLLITLSSIQSKQLIGILMFLQLVYIAYVLIVRPYKEAKSNLIEIINEIYFSLFLVTLMIFNKENEWSTLTTNIYVWILVSNSLVVFLIVLIYSIVELVHMINNRCKKTSDNQEVTTKVAPLPPFIHGSIIYPHQLIHKRQEFNNQSEISENRLKEENKYSVHENLSEIQIIPKKNWD